MLLIKQLSYGLEHGNFVVLVIVIALTTRTMMMKKRTIASVLAT